MITNPDSFNIEVASYYFAENFSDSSKPFNWDEFKISCINHTRSTCWMRGVPFNKDFVEKFIDNLEYSSKLCE